MESFRLLVIADSHYASSPQGVISTSPARKCLLGKELIRRTIADAQRQGGFDAIALMGDLIDNGTSPTARADLEAIRDEIRTAAPDTPLIIVPGNHDGDPYRLFKIFATPSNLYDIGQYGFIVFTDTYAPDESCMRSQADRKIFTDLAAKTDKPIIALQHNPIHPPIESDYPYILVNRSEVMADYSAAGVVLSISGHYHPGQPLSFAGNVGYLTVPAICQAPFRYALITLTGREFSVSIRSLMASDDPPLIDCHAHTEFAYCAEDVTIDAVLDRARTFGLAGQVFAEHAGQLYCSADDFWAARHIRQPKVWKTQENSRMANYLRTMQEKRDDFTRIGLEVELDIDGNLTLHDEDRQQIDLIIGAVHWIKDDPKELTDAELTDEFMQTTLKLIESDIDILAHPWRFFRRANREVPTHLYSELAQALAENKVAAEINFHTNTPDVAFFAQCVARGVKISLATDAHAIYEAGHLSAHLALLKQITDENNITNLLFQI